MPIQKSLMRYFSHTMAILQLRSSLPLVTMSVGIRASSIGRSTKCARRFPISTYRRSQVRRARTPRDPAACYLCFASKPPKGR